MLKGIFNSEKYSKACCDNKPAYYYCVYKMLKKLYASEIHNFPILRFCAIFRFRCILDQKAETISITVIPIL